MAENTSSVSKTVKVSAPDLVTCPAEVEPSSVFSTEAGSTHEFYGTICESSASELTVALRTGKALKIEMAGWSNNPPFLLTPGRPVHVEAVLKADGQFRAVQIVHSHIISSATPPDR